VRLRRQNIVLNRFFGGQAIALTAIEEPAKIFFQTRRKPLPTDKVFRDNPRGAR
jgi:hypothetical protein